LALKYALNKRRRTYRVAVVVSRKVDKSAVVRNRIRRRIYEVVRLNAGRLREPYDLVFTVFGDQLADMEAERLRKLVHGQLKKAGVLAATEKPAHGIVKTED
jgi:ribonuclease P protein component